MPDEGSSHTEGTALASSQMNGPASSTGKDWVPEHGKGCIDPVFEDNLTATVYSLTSQAKLCHWLGGGDESLGKQEPCIILFVRSFVNRDAQPSMRAFVRLEHIQELQRRWSIPLPMMDYIFGYHWQGLEPMSCIDPMTGTTWHAVPFSKVEEAGIPFDGIWPADPATIFAVPTHGAQRLHSLRVLMIAPDFDLHNVGEKIIKDFQRSSRSQDQRVHLLNLLTITFSHALRYWTSVCRAAASKYTTRVGLTIDLASELYQVGNLCY